VSARSASEMKEKTLPHLSERGWRCRQVSVVPVTSVGGAASSSSMTLVVGGCDVAAAPRRRIHRCRGWW
jgi:hypothetical protein